MELTKFDKIKAEIDIARDVRELIKIKDKLELIRLAVKQQDGSMELVNSAQRYKIEIERRIGEEYRKLESDKGRKGVSVVNRIDDVTDKKSAQEEIGRSRETVNRWVKLSDVPEVVINEYEKKCNHEDVEMTDSGLLRFNNEKLKKEKPDSAPLPANKFQVIYADPPWEYDTKQSSKAVHENYPTMNFDELIEFGEEVRKIAADDCVLYMWATSARLDWAIPVMEAWGFQYKTSMVWDKVRHNLGFYASVRHEFLLIGGRGRSRPDDTKLANGIDSVQVIEKTGVHSQKPEEFAEIIEKLYPGKKKIELFSRSNRPGWKHWGNDAPKQ